MRTLWNLSRINPGFNVEHLALFAVEQPEIRYPTPTEIVLHQRIEERLRVLSGVRVGDDGGIAIHRGFVGGRRFSAGRENRGHQQVKQNAYTNVVDKLLSDDGDSDRRRPRLQCAGQRTSTHVAVISEKLAREAFPGTNPIGKHFLTRSEPKAGKPGEWLQIVGVCADTYY